MSITDFFRKLFKASQSEYQPVVEDIIAGLNDGSLHPMQIRGIINRSSLDSHSTNPRQEALRQAILNGYKVERRLSNAVDIAQKNLFRNIKQRVETTSVPVAKEKVMPTISAIRLEKTSEAHLSKFGGRPNLPDSIPWPKNPEGGVLDFLAQIHFPEVPAGLGLPETGTLFVFYDNEAMPWGNEEKDVNYWKVIYSAEPLPDAVRTRTPSDKECYEFNEIFLTFEVFESHASDADTLENENGHHQMLGHPLYIQDDDMAPGQTLLLQIDTDEEDDGPCWMWGDCGRLFFWIRPEDLAIRRFDKTKMKLECY